MSLDNINARTAATESATDAPLVSLTSFSISDIREQKKEYCAAPVKGEEAEKQRMDARIEKAFGKDLLTHIKDHDWLVDHSATLKTGFNRIFDGRGEEFTVGQIAGRLKDLSGGLIYGEVSTGGKNPYTTSVPDSHYRVYLKRSYWFDTELFHQVTKYLGPGLDRTERK